MKRHREDRIMQDKPKFMTRLRRSLGRAGQTTTEYVLILAIAVMVVMKIKDQIGKRVDGAINKIDTELGKWDQQ
jgi:Flp pilus assembly pilin Flp